MNKLSHKFYPVCNEHFLSINLVLKMYCRCYINKNEVKKFFTENNMDSGNVPEELKGLTDVKEMLIA